MEITDKIVSQVQNGKNKIVGFISQLFFLWIIPLFYKGNSKDLKLEDLNGISNENCANNLAELLQREWETECNKAINQEKKRPHLLRALLRAFGSRYAYFIGIFMFDGWVIRIAQPIFLRQFIHSFSEESPSSSAQCFYASGVCVTTFLHTLLNHPTAFQMCVSGMKCRVAVSSLIYRKALRLSNSAQKETSTGQIVNLLSNDVSRFDYNLHFIAFFFVGPVQLLIFFCILYAELGAASIVGVGYIALLSPSQYFIGKFSAKYRVKIAEKTDERSKIMSEIITAMRLIKMYAWEKPFSTVIHRIRSLEIKALQNRSFLRAAFMGVFTSNFTYVPFLTILSYGLAGYPVTADKAFFTVAVFNVMTEIMMYYVPNAAATMGELIASIERIEEFLLLEEHGVQDKLACNNNISDGVSIKMDNVYASWSPNEITLKNCTVDLSGNQLVMIVGPVGCGKSSFLQTLLSELRIKEGKCFVDGTTSYCSQEPWIFPGTIRQNILLGRELDKKRYNDILNVCALEEDLEQFYSGDLTLVGEKGTTLSGGQKARVNLARALYQDVNIFLLDDPLSAVDAATSRHIFEKCIQKYLQNRMRILVTHQMQYLPQADYIIAISEGKIISQGKYEDLVREEFNFGRLLEDFNKEEDEEDNSELLDENSSGIYEEISLSKKCLEDDRGMKISKVQKEKMETGSVSSETYWKYFKAGESICGISFLISGFITNQLLISSTDYWLSYWTNTEEFHRKNHLRETNLSLNATFLNALNKEEILSGTSYQIDSGPFEYFQRNVYIIVYAGLATGVFLVGTTRTIYLFAYCMKISSNFHNKMFSSLIRAPIKFFDQNSSGRVMNRFTKDIGAIDESIAPAIFDTLDIFFRMVGILIIVIVANYVLCIPVIFLLMAYVYLRYFFVKTARNIKRIESVARSPMYTHLAATIQGLTTIRASNSQEILTAQFNKYQDNHSVAWYNFIAGNNWFSIWLEMTSTLFIVIVTTSFVLMSRYTTSGKVGLAVASLLQLMNIFQFGMRQSAEAENLMTSVERALEYVQIEPEASLQSKKGQKPPKDWPFRGALKFRNVSLSYDNSQDVLRNMSFDIRPQEKIGIVGRTGAGKSSIINALFRLTEPRGDIVIDDVLIKDLGLHDVRKNISIIPQDSVLFSGTIRYNMDPFDNYSDDEIWKTLEDVELKDAIPALDYKVSENGRNFSVGQRQLICLARSLLSNNKIIVLDEATANIDHRTDTLIQHTLRTKLQHCTIITIAHRLDSVIDCDKILVIENGCIVEFGHPSQLLQNPKGALSSLVAQTGKASHGLRQIAAEGYLNNHHRVRK